MRLPGTQAGVGPPPCLPAELRTTRQWRGAARARLAPASPDAVGELWEL